MFIDNVKIKVIAGRGGNGAVAFNTVKMALGPTGGSGAKGGDIYIEAIADLGALRHFRTKKVFNAHNGENGRGQFRDGHRGEDLILYVPRGAVINNITTGEEHELITLGQRILVAHGGNGGKGNFLYRSPINTTPKQFQKGKEGDICTLQLELKLIANIGLIGLPNIGKTSFLNEITNAQNKVANYQFTTLEPNLGAYHALVLADIPGLIEGASEGRGLGIKFLKHIERTGTLFHFIGADSSNPLLDYKAVRQELGIYNTALLEKKEYIIVSKTDLIDKKRIVEITRILKPLNKNIYPISIYNMDQMNAIRKLLDQIAKENVYTRNAGLPSSSANVA